MNVYMTVYSSVTPFGLAAIVKCPFFSVFSVVALEVDYLDALFVLVLCQPADSF